MARPFRPEFAYPIHELTRFFRYQDSVLAPLRYPSCTPFAKFIARGTLAPTPDDQPMDWVGAWYSQWEPVDKTMLALKFDFTRQVPVGSRCEQHRNAKDPSKKESSPGGRSDYAVGRECGMSARQVKQRWTWLISDLGGYLRGRNAVAKAA